MFNYKNTNSLEDKEIENFLNEDSSSIQIARNGLGIEIITLKEDLPVNVIVGVKAINEGIAALANELSKEKNDNILNNNYSNLEKILKDGKITVKKEKDKKSFNTKLSVSPQCEDIVLYNLYGNSLVEVLNFAESYFSSND